MDTGLRLYLDVGELAITLRSPCKKAEAEGSNADPIDIPRCGVYCWVN